LESNVSHSTTGDRLFVEFHDQARRGHVAIVSSNGVRVAEAPPNPRLNDQGEAALWIKSANDCYHVQGGLTLPHGIYCGGCPADARFAVFWKTNDGAWLASLSSPLEPLVTLTENAFTYFEHITCYKDRLHLFTRDTAEEGQQRPFPLVLKHYEYEIHGTNLRLQRVQDFRSTGSVIDFDPETNLMYVLGWLVNTQTGARSSAPVARYGLFLQDGVVRQLRATLKGESITWVK
jgi:hypothetical protein